MRYVETVSQSFSAALTLAPPSYCVLRHGFEGPAPSTEATPKSGVRVCEMLPKKTSQSTGCTEMPARGETLSIVACRNRFPDVSAVYASDSKWSYLSPPRSAIHPHETESCKVKP